MKIEFISKYADWFLHPVPVKKVMPDWYKKLDVLINKNQNMPTIRKCVPVLDAVSMGYAILAPSDLAFTKEAHETFEDGSCNYKITGTTGREDLIQKPNPPDLNYKIEGHAQAQVAEDTFYPDEMPMALKLLNPWIIKTPPGYSCIFTPPFNTERRDIRIITGIVDTDKFLNHVNFPFALRDWDETKNPIKIVKKGTPIALVFPFKRDDWKMEVKHETKLYEKHMNKWGWDYFSNYIDIYRNKIWTKKNYK